MSSEGPLASPCRIRYNKRVGYGAGVMLPQQRTEASTARKRFRIVLIKPSHYDDDGYVIRWYRSPMPANSLASVYGLIDDCAQRQILGPDVDIEVAAIDETNTRVRVDRIITDMRANNNFGFVGLVGVQSNQYPRALHIAKPLREAGIAVDHRRVSRLRHAGDVPERDGRPARGARYGRHFVRRRGGRPHGRGGARCRQRRAQADL